MLIIMFKMMWMIIKGQESHKGGGSTRRDNNVEDADGNVQDVDNDVHDDAADNHEVKPSQCCSTASDLPQRRAFGSA